jgi:hypothetical protein
LANDIFKTSLPMVNSDLTHHQNGYSIQHSLLFDRFSYNEKR